MAYRPNTTSKEKYTGGPVKPENIRADPKIKVHPNSLANLRPRWDKEHMKKMTENSHKARQANKEAREQMKLTLNIFKEVSEGLIDQIPDGVTVMKMAMAKAMQDDDFTEAARLAAVLAEYQQPKLQRTENFNANMDFSDLSDEELKVQMDKLNNVKDVTDAD